MVPEVTLSLAIYDYLPMLIWGAGSYFLIDAIKKDMNGGGFLLCFNIIPGVSMDWRLSQGYLEVSHCNS